VRARLRPGGEHGLEQRRDPLVVVRAWVAAARRVGQASKPTRVKAPAPMPDGLHREPEGAGDLRVALASGGAQDDLRPAHLAVGERARMRRSGERAALRVGEGELELAGPAGQHGDSRLGPQRAARVMQ
jgi:hypothetical protein